MKRKKYRDINELVYTTTLENKMKVYFLPKPGFMEKTAMIVSKFGSFDSMRKIKVNNKMIKIPEGVAHFLEHRMFSIKNADASDLFADLGANCNAFTSYNKTAYYFSCTDNFYQNLEILLKLVDSFDSSEKQVENEKNIIIEELNMYKDDPIWGLFLNLYEAAYENHPIRNDIGGTTKSVQSTNKEILQACFDVFYDPSNLTLVICGDLNENEIELFLKNHLLLTKNKKKITSLKINESIDKLAESFTFTTNVTTPQFALLFKLKPLEKKERILKSLCYYIILEYLFSSSGYYTEKWLTEKIITSELSYEHIENIDLNAIILYNENVNYKSCLEEIYNVFKQESLALTEKELVVIKNKMYGLIFKSFSNVEGLSRQYVNYLFRETNVYDEIGILKNITIDDIYTVFVEISKAKSVYVIAKGDKND